jgi:hypothetical protein
MSVNWSAAPNALQPFQTGQQGAAFGLELGQKQASINALQNVDINDPASVDAGIKSSIRAANLEQASALMNLNVRRSVLAGLPSLMGAIGGQGGAGPGGGQPPATSGAAAVPSAGAAPDQAGPGAAPAALTPDQMAQHSAIMGQAAQAVTDLQNTPEAERPAKAAAIKQRFAAMGIPEAAIDAHLSDLSDPGLKASGDYFNGVIAAGQPAGAGGVAPTMPAHPSGFAWAKSLLQNPQLMAQMELYKGFGIDTTGLIDQARGIAMPEIQKQADLAYAGPIAAATAGAQKGVELAYAPALAGVEVAKAGATAAATAPVEVEKAREEAQNAANIAASKDVIDVPFTDPSTGVTQQVKMTRADYINHQRAADLPGLGLATSAANTEFQKGDAESLQKTAATAADPARIQQHQQAVITGNQIRDLALGLGTGKYTGQVSAIAQTLGPLMAAAGVPSDHMNQYATNAQLLANDLTQAAKQQFGGSALPRVKSEFDMLMKAVPNAGSPAGTIALTGAGLAAKANYESEYDQFMTNWAADASKPKSLTAANAAWMAGPGRRSVLADPAFQSFTLFGKPVVQIAPQPLKDGHVYGVFMPGTPQAQTFVAK